MSDVRVALQRTLPNDSGTRWKTMHRCKADDAEELLNLADRMGRIGDPIFFRLVRDDQDQYTLLRWTPDRGWH